MKHTATRVGQPFLGKGELQRYHLLCHRTWREGKWFVCSRPFRAAMHRCLSLSKAVCLLSTLQGRVMQRCLSLSKAACLSTLRVAMLDNDKRLKALLQTLLQTLFNSRFRESAPRLCLESTRLDSTECWRRRYFPVSGTSHYRS